MPDYSGKPVGKMTQVDTRQTQRDSLFLLAQVRVDGQEKSHSVKVRNLSAGGMMAEADLKVARGTLISVELRNLGWVEGTVAWKQDNRFGIAFLDQIDPAKVRGAGVEEAPESQAPRHSAKPAPRQSDGRLRKI